MSKSTLLLALLFTFFMSCMAQPGALDLSFRGTGAGDHVRSTAVQADGRIIIVGDFLYYNDTTLNHIARVLDNGGIDTSFKTGVGTDAKIYALALQPDGKIIIGGDFFNYNGTPSNHLARLNINGTIDTSFHLGSGTDYHIKAICVQTDGKVLMGGNFLHYNGTSCNRIIRINPDGSVDTTFNPGAAANGTVECIALQKDGKIIVGGSFTNFNGTLDIRIARLDSNGTIDSSFNQGFGGTNSTVIAIALQNDSNIIIGGNFTTYNLQSLNHIARLSPTGDPNNNFFEGSGANSSVQAIHVDPNTNEILIAGSFTSYFNGTPINRIARLKPDGRLDSTFNVGFSGCDGDIASISIQPNGKIIIGGNFLTYNDSVRHRIARLYNCLTPQPDSIYGTDYALCNGTAQTYYVTPVAGATQYEWTLPNGWLGSSDSSSITAISDGTGGTITVKAFTDSCGYSYATARAIATIKPTSVNICLVTVDTASTHNIVIWEKPVTQLIDSFFIYRETSTNVYTKIIALPYDSLSEYHDYAANPNVTSYRYKLSVLDTCGAESELSPYHNTIHFQNLGSGNFQWTFYQIENASNPVMSFNIYRDNLGNGNFFPIGNVPGTNATFFDNTFGSFLNSEYVIDANWGISCTPTRAVNTTRSNKRPRNAIDVLSTGNTLSWVDMVQVYPNPSSTVVYIDYATDIHITGLQLFNYLGQTVLSKTETDDLHRLAINLLPAGVYTLRLETNVGRVLKKIVIQ